MKRGLAILTFFLLIFLISNVQSPATITGQIITGKTTSQGIIMNITVSINAPTLTIHSPENQTYLTNTSILLNYTSNSNDLWYKLEMGNNITINSPIYFNVSQGSQILYLYANNSHSTVTKNVTFTTNSSFFIIIDDEYGETEDNNEDEGKMGRNDKMGESTDFLNYTYEDLQNLSGIILENTNYGKMRFNAQINLTADEDFSDNQLNINAHTNISNNRIELNATALPNFNISSTLSLYNLTFTTPRILKDGSLCSSIICTQQSYTGGTLIFNVTSFSIYSAEETSVSSSTSSSGSTGSGGGTGKIIATPGEIFTIDKEIISINLKQGETKEEIIKITNKGIEIIKINLEKPEKLRKMINIDEKEFELKPDETKEIRISFLAEKDLAPNIYIGKIIVRADGIEKEILINIEVETKKALFDVKINVPDKFPYVLPGEEFLSEIQLYNLGDTGKVDVSIDYIIKDEYGNQIMLEHETIAVETQASFVKTIIIPENAFIGAHILYVKVSYQDSVASASAWFNVGKAPSLKNSERLIVYAILLLIIIVVISILFEIRKIRKIKNKRKRKK